MSELVSVDVARSNKCSVVWDDASSAMLLLWLFSKERDTLSSVVATAAVVVRRWDCPVLLDAFEDASSVDVVVVVVIIVVSVQCCCCCSSPFGSGRDCNRLEDEEDDDDVVVPTRITEEETHNSMNNEVVLKVANVTTTINVKP